MGQLPRPWANSMPNRRPQNKPEQRPDPRMSSSSGSSRTFDSNSLHFDSLLAHPPPTTHISTSVAKPHYHPDLHPLPSFHRPHCLARDKLCFWILTVTSERAMGNTTPTVVSEAALDHILEVTDVLWAESTKELYGTGLLVFHIYCNINHISESEWCPVSQALLLSFLASCAGAHSSSTISNYLMAIKEQHLLHSHSWEMNQDKLRLTLQGAAHLAPHSSKQPKC